MMNWIAKGFSVMGAYFNSKHKNLGNLLWIIGNPIWIIYFFLIGETAPMMLFGYYEITALLGFRNWSKSNVSII